MQLYARHVADAACQAADAHRVAQETSVSNAYNVVVDDVAWHASVAQSARHHSRHFHSPTRVLQMLPLSSVLQMLWWLSS